MDAHRVRRCVAASLSDDGVSYLQFRGWICQETLCDRSLVTFDVRQCAFPSSPQCPGPAFRPLPPDLHLGQVLCFKHRRRVARDNTVKFQRHTLQLLPDRQRRSYAGAAVLVLHGLDGRLSLQHEGRIIAAQEAPASPGSLRYGIKPPSDGVIHSLNPESLGELRATVREPLAMVAAANGHGSMIDDEDVVSMTVTTAPSRPTFLQRARWDAIQKAKLEGMSICRMARELGLHRDTVRRYIDAESPPTRRAPATPPVSTSDTIPA